MKKDVLTRPFPPELIKQRQGQGGKMLSYVETHAVIAAAHARGQDDARVHSGDPSLYGAIAEQIRRLTADGIHYAIVPGVPAFAAAAAALGQELTVPELAQSVVLTRMAMKSSSMPPGETLENFARTGATLVVHLAITRTRELMGRIEPIVGGDCPVVVVYRASQPAQLVLRGRVDDIADAVEEAGLRQAAVILVGRALADDPHGAGESHLYCAERVRRVSPTPTG